MINWHQNQLAYLKEQWLVDASVRLNPKLKLSPKYQISAVHAITRLDLSSNDLSEIPPIIFQMQSLRSLCLAQNKIEVLPPPYQMKGKRISLSGMYYLFTLPFPSNRLQTWKFCVKMIHQEPALKHFSNLF